MAEHEEVEVTLDNLANILAHDISVKVAGVDVDGVLRGKLMAKKKFLSIAEDGFGFCSVVFGWDMHDKTYFRELKISNKENGYRDLIAVPDLKTYRRIPWENNVPLFLVKFLDPDTLRPISACPRSLLRRAVENIEKEGYKAMAGGKQSSLLFTTLNPKAISLFAIH
jgi:glutamine synthetase